MALFHKQKSHTLFYRNLETKSTWRVNLTAAQTNRFTQYTVFKFQIVHNKIKDSKIKVPEIQTPFTEIS